MAPFSSGAAVYHVTCVDSFLIAHSRHRSCLFEPQSFIKSQVSRRIGGQLSRRPLPQLSRRMLSRSTPLRVAATKLFINGEFKESKAKDFFDVHNPVRLVFFPRCIVAPATKLLNSLILLGRLSPFVAVVFCCWSALGHRRSFNAHACCYTRGDD